MVLTWKNLFIVVSGFIPAQTFVPMLLGELSIEALVHGNLTQHEATALADSVRGSLPATKWLLAEARSQEQCTALRPGTTYLYRCVAPSEHAKWPCSLAWPAILYCVSIFLEAIDTG